MHFSHGFPLRIGWRPLARGLQGQALLQWRRLQPQCFYAWLDKEHYTLLTGSNLSASIDISNAFEWRLSRWGCSVSPGLI
jgi:hypothetical protein